ncbi:hypothetical protein [Haloarcula litorea]|uniref:hypothetical protein n=1 Tax=Haloarcula litorea TaxID=3032579 RepID=UPI0023E86251|nr:hypothetical protein [Halomicroarcula sp. GDY20]
MSAVRPAVLLCAVLCLTAGCQTLAADRQQPATPTTPAPVPTATGDLDVDGERFARRHRRGIGNRTFTIRVSFTATYENGSSGTLRDRIVVGEGERYVRSRRYAGPFPRAAPNRTLWRDASGTAVRQTFDNGSTAVRRGNRFVLNDPTLSRFLGRVVEGFDLTRTDAGRRLTGTDGDPGSLPVPRGFGDIRDSRLTVLVRDGIVRRLVVTYEGSLSRGGGTATIRFDLSVVDVGETTVTEPAWVPAGNETSTNQTGTDA